jgi:AraC family transcriptional regulator
MRERGLLFAELVQGVGEAIPKHTHHAAFYHRTLAGGYEESTARGMRSFPPFSSAFIAGDTRHFARVGNAGVHLFTMEMDSRWIQELREAGGEVENTDDSIGGVLTCVGLRLYREYKAGDGANALTVDSLAWEFLAAAARMRREKCTKPPAWWRRIVDLLHSESARDLRVADLAREASVHPVHLARVFRRLTNQTPGEWRCSSFAFTLLQGVKRGHAGYRGGSRRIGLGRSKSSDAHAEASHLVYSRSVSRYFRKVSWRATSCEGVGLESGESQTPI